MPPSEPVPSPRQLVEGIYAAFARHDLPWIFARCAADIVWTSFGPQQWPTTRSFLGVDQVKLFFSLFTQVCSPRHLSQDRWFCDGDAVIVQGHEIGVMSATGLPMENHWVHLYTVRDGLLVRFSECICNRTEYPPPAPARKP